MYFYILKLEIAVCISSPQIGDLINTSMVIHIGQTFFFINSYHDIQRVSYEIIHYGWEYY